MPLSSLQVRLLIFSPEFAHVVSSWKVAFGEPHFGDLSQILNLRAGL